MLKRHLSVLLTAALLFVSSAASLAYDQTASGTMVETEAPVMEALSYTTLPTYYGYESMLNAQLSCKFWTDKLIAPMETIAFMSTMSLGNAYEGMVDAPVISGVDQNGESIVSTSLGGGICATAVALGNACDGKNVVATGTEHTTRSSYVREEDKDYTVAEGVVELYLTNYSAYTYKINMWINADTSITAALTPLTEEQVKYYTQE